MIRQSYLATFRTILTDRAVFLMLVGAAILYSFFYPSAYSGEVPVRIPIAVVDNDHSATSRALISKVGALQQARIAARPESAQAAFQLLQEGKVDALLFIPPGFQQKIWHGGQGQVALYGNGAYLLRSSTAMTALGDVLQSLGVEVATSKAIAEGAMAAPPLAVIQRPLFNTREGYGSAVVPGVSFLIIQQTILMGMAMLAATMRERQGPHSFRPKQLLGIALAFATIGMAAVIYYTGFVFWFQDYPRAGARGVTLLVSGLLFVGATVAAALALSSFFRTRERPAQLWIITSLPIFFLSNLSWPAEQTPGWLVMLSRLLPTTPGIHLMVGTNQMGASLSEQLPALLNLGILILLYGSIAYLRLTPRISKPG